MFLIYLLQKEKTRNYERDNSKPLSSTWAWYLKYMCTNHDPSWLVFDLWVFSYENC